jgi:hypothetical protein
MFLSAAEGPPLPRRHRAPPSPGTAGVPFDVGRRRTGCRPTVRSPDGTRHVPAHGDGRDQQRPGNELGPSGRRRGAERARSGNGRDEPKARPTTCATSRPRPSDRGASVWCRGAPPALRRARGPMSTAGGPALYSRGPGAGPSRTSAFRARDAPRHPPVNTPDPADRQARTPEGHRRKARCPCVPIPRTSR